jgi:hypothetical protein
MAIVALRGCHQLCTAKGGLWTVNFFKFTAQQLAFKKLHPAEGSSGETPANQSF